MAIRTELFPPDLKAVCDEWGLGTLLSFRGLPEGSVNTLYAFESTSGKQVLRLSEGRAQPEVDFETALLRHLHKERFPAVELLPRANGKPYGVVRDRFACVFTWAAGHHLAPRDLIREQALEVGRILGRLHVVGQSLAASLPNRYSPAQIQKWIDELSGNSSGDAAVAEVLPWLKREGQLLDTLPPASEGIIHADFFPDNIKWIGDRISSVLDFEMACRGPYVLDLATCLHSFCWDGDKFVVGSLQGIVEGYLSEKSLSANDRSAFFAWARFAGLRFTVSRIRDFHLSTLGNDKLLKKDWRRFKARTDALIEMGADGWLHACGLS